DWATFDSGLLPEHRWVAEDGGELLGWGAVTPVSARAVYAGVGEDSGHGGAAARGRGVGAALLDRLIASTEAAGIWTIQSGVFPENRGSLAPHDRAGLPV